MINRRCSFRRILARAYQVQGIPRGQGGVDVAVDGREAHNFDLRRIQCHKYRQGVIWGAQNPSMAIAKAREHSHDEPQTIGKNLRATFAVGPKRNHLSLGRCRWRSSSSRASPPWSSLNRAEDSRRCRRPAPPTLTNPHWNSDKARPVGGLERARHEEPGICRARSLRTKNPRSTMAACLSGVSTGSWKFPG